MSEVAELRLLKQRMEAIEEYVVLDRAQTRQEEKLRDGKGDEMTICKNCKHFSASEQYALRTGWCNIELPNWLVVSLKELHDGMYRFVRADSSCDLGE